MKYNNSLNLKCPHCKGQCQFIVVVTPILCKIDDYYHSSFRCTHCSGIIMIRFNGYKTSIIDYVPVVSKWKPKTDSGLISDENVKKDFLEAIKCFNYGFYNASMVMSRRAIHQEMISRDLDKEYPNNLYLQIENSDLSDNLKKLLQKVKNFGNNGAHPDFCLYDENENKLEDEDKFAELSLNFLDKYFSDKYEIESMISSAPSSKKEIVENNN